MVKRIFGERWRWAWGTLRLSDMIANGRYDDALQLIETQTEHNRPTSWRIHELAIHHWKGDDLWVIDHTEDILDAVRRNLFFSPAERLYLEAYVSLVAQRSSGIVVKDGRAGERAYPINYNAIDLDHIAARWKRWFPLITHPDWVT